MKCKYSKALTESGFCRTACMYCTAQQEYTCHIKSKQEEIVATTIEPPVVHGEWVDNGDYVTTAYGSLNVYRCSNCNAEVTIDDHDNYCPNCGADMRCVE